MVLETILVSLLIFVNNSVYMNYTHFIFIAQSLWSLTFNIFVLQNRRARHKTCYGFDCFGVSKNIYSTYKKVTKATESSLTSLSSDSSKVSQSKIMSTKGKHEKETSRGSAILEKQKKFEFHSICLVLISLVFTVFFGKLFGIVLTSIWIFLFSLCNSNYRCRKMLPYGARYSVVYSPKYMDVNGHYRKWSTIMNIIVLRDKSLHSLYFLKKALLATDDNEGTSHFRVCYKVGRNSFIFIPSAFPSNWILCSYNM